MAMDLNQLMALLDDQKQKQTALERVAATQVTNQPIMNPGQTRADLMFGRNSTPEQKRGVNAFLGSILNRDPGKQTAIGAATDGFERGSQLMDEIRTKAKAEKLYSADTALKGAQNQFAGAADIYGLKTTADNTAYDRSIDTRDFEYQKQRDKIEDSQFSAEMAAGGQERVFASQVKAHEAAVSEVYRADVGAQKAEQLSAELEALSSTVSGGLRGQLSSVLKNNAGVRDAASYLRTRANSLVNVNVINNLPPGVASDRDIEIAMRGYPNPETATFEELKEFADALAKIERGNAIYQRARVDWADKNNYDMRGFQSAWDKQRAEESKQQQQKQTQGPSGAPQIQFSTPEGAAAYEKYRTQ